MTFPLSNRARIAFIIIGIVAGITAAVGIIGALHLVLSDTERLAVIGILAASIPVTGQVVIAKIQAQKSATVNAAIEVKRDQTAEEIKQVTVQAVAEVKQEAKNTAIVVAKKLDTATQQQGEALGAIHDLLNSRFTTASALAEALREENLMLRGYIALHVTPEILAHRPLPRPTIPPEPIDPHEENPT